MVEFFLKSFVIIKPYVVVNGLIEFLFCFALRKVQRFCFEV